MKDITGQLTALERKILPLLVKRDFEASELAGKAGLREVEVLRAGQWLQNKGLAVIEREEEEIIVLDRNGKEYLEKGLPEKRFLKAISTSSLALSQILKKGISKEEVNICIGILRRKNAVIVVKEKELIFTITEQGKKALKEKMLEEKILEKKYPLKEQELKPEEKHAVSELLKRKNILRKETKKTFTLKATDKAKKSKCLKEELSQDYAEKLTGEMLKTGSWKNKKFRSYDVKSPVPKIYPGRKHFVTEAIEYIKKIWLELGFEEMTGNEVQSAFWDMDALFVPQDHPAREMQDTFYLEGKASLPKKYLAKVKAAHENGGNTGSKGWQYDFSEETSSQVMLRTHTTVLSALTLSKLKKEDLPKKYFIVGKVYRNEALDWKHLFEFHQVEGIVVDPEGSLAKLKGYLKEFFLKMGYTDVRIRPAYFPYTEPSAEVEVYHPEKKVWIELGGAGIFRPEVTKPLLGFECPVLAWGMGMERIITAYYDIKDLRDIYKNDLEQLRNAKLFIKK